MQAPSPFLRTWLIGLGAFVVYALTATYDTHTALDPLATLVPAWQVAHHGNLSLDHIRASTPFFIHEHGRLVSNRLPGAIFLAVPFYWLLSAGTTQPTFFPAGIAAAAIAAVAVVLFYRLARHFVSERVAVGATLVFAFVSPTWSISADGLWTHGPGQLMLLAALLCLAHRKPLFAGMFFGGAVLARPHLALIAAAVGIGYLTRRQWRDAFALGPGVLMGVGLLLLYNYDVYHVLSLRGGYDVSAGGVGLKHFPVNLAGAFVSPERGIFVWSLFLLPLVVGLRAAWRQAPDWVRWTAIGSTAYLLLQAWLTRFSGGDGFLGYRYPIEPLTALAPIFVLSWQTFVTRRTWLRRTTLIAVTYTAAITTLGAMLYRGAGIDDPWRTWGLGHTFRTVSAGKTSAALVVGVAATALAIWLFRRVDGPTEGLRATDSSDSADLTASGEKHDLAAQHS